MAHRVTMEDVVYSRQYAALGNVEVVREGA